MLVDLNVKWPQESYEKPAVDADIERLRATLVTLSTLGYTHVVLNFTVNHSDKFPNNIKELNPMKIDERFEDIMRGTGLKIYSRITLIIDDPSKGQSLSKISQAFDIVAALPISERGLTLATTNLDVDLLTFDYGQRLPTFLKHKSICSCVNRGVKIEIVYGYAVRDIHARRQFVSNVRSVVRSSRSRGIVISSGSEGPLECRNILGVISLIKTLGLPSDKCTKAMGEFASLVLLNGRLRNKSHKQTIVVGGGKIDVVNDIEGIDNAKNIKIVKRSMDDDFSSKPHTKKQKN
ncbi:hypothetical protein KAFR_0D04600 [Kazachstania africana CBS 2517]|uniref:Uncharacterized protein n=1 Tax=Kazachstania africana (strain ATCC 22294 / BCRC 22015 / CBS 2517 / CECT 1963 / NBRC 1671 / NRRL Y-8276) TaxID=1071382 RepID=H2AUQ8_KAZAF|nr:hypothetical protein KAFR_0D04600 [Kazachstania africana CBS 2517]CCF58108.1 hypothetical protein KAFR_0D04600 [Kazachstania africana CBS 2517]